MAQRASAPRTLTDIQRFTKNQKIKESGIATRERRKNMDVKVRDLKIVTSSLNNKQKEALERLFLEYKWLRNSALASERFDLEYLKEIGNTVRVKMPDGSFEKRDITYLGSQMKQQVINELKSNLKTLSSLKKKGKKVGKLKFIREAKSIGLQQFGVTYELYENVKRKHTKVRVQNVPGKLRVRGFEQLNHEGIEFANAKIVKRPDGYHLLVTTYIPRDVVPKPQSKIGVDFGVKTSFTLDDGTKVNAVIEETERLKRLQRKLSRQIKGSNGYKHTLGKIQREYQKINYRKDELAKKLVQQWTCDNIVFYQDENISGWKHKKSTGNGCRKIQYGILGRVKALLQHKENTVMLPRWVATTAWCSECGSLTSHGVGKRVFECSACYHTEDRDIHAAKNMIVLGEKYQHITSGTEGSAGGASVRLVEQLYKVAPEQLAMKPETACALDTP